jgi:single-strand DNA-binding protein
MSGIECAFFGFLPADAEPRTSAAGKAWTRMRVGVGKDDALQWVSVAVFGRAAEAAANLKKGDRCYIEGSVKLESWRGNDGVERHGLSVAAFKCEQTHLIGRNKPQRDRAPADGRHKLATGKPAATSASNSAAAFDDDIPFAPEWRG